MLLHHSRGGLVFLPGAAGTVQEIFTAATPDYYGAADVQIRLVLVGTAYWTGLPAWPLLQALAENRPMASSIATVDSAAQAVAVLTD